MQHTIHSQRAGSWAEIQELLFDGSWNDNIGRFRSPYVYRGMGDASFDLRTSLMRLGGPYWDLERHLLRNFRKYAEDGVEKGDSVWHLLMLAQQHGLPTRLLDWTYSPLVAMHFATSELKRYDRDGVIWKVDYHEAARRLPNIFGQALTEEGANVFTVEMLMEQVDSLPLFDKASADDFFLFVEPPSMTPRMVNQYALFSVASNPQRSLDELFVEDNAYVSRIVIPAELKWEVRDKLDQSNVNERMLFPGLDGLSEWLKRHYSPSHEYGR